MDELTQRARGEYRKLYQFLDRQTWCPKPILWMALFVVASALWLGFAVAWCMRLLMKPAR